MAYDAGMMRGALHELSVKCIGAKTEKIYQPQKDEIDILFKSGRETFRLCINAGCACPRLSLTDEAKENPAVAPMFCMLLRKHLSGAKLLRVEQIGFERVARLVFSCYDDMGYKVERMLYAEIMGKYSNLIFTDACDKIIAPLRTVDLTTSRKRQVLPGMTYALPPSQDKADPMEETRDGFILRARSAQNGEPADRFITNTYLGISRHSAREIAYIALGDSAQPLDWGNIEALADAFIAWFDRLRRDDYSPCAIIGNDGKPIEYSFFESKQYGSGATCVEYNSFSELFDSYFGERDRTERIKQRASDILHLLSSADSRLTKKLASLREELAQSEHGDEYRLEGDLITANIYRLTRGMTSFTATDYSSGESREVTLSLDARLTPAQNAQRCYKKYTKARNARAMLTSQIEKAEEELRYIEGVKSFLDVAESEAELCEIRDELYRSGYASRMKSYTAAKMPKTHPAEFVTDGGYRLICGKNNIQNEKVTFDIAGKGDLWFHVKGMPGSHVVLICNGEEPSERDYTQAAELAAYYSKAGGKSSSGSLVTVDYTRVKNVRKPSGARPGFVIYKTNYSANVLPRITVRKVTK